MHYNNQDILRKHTALTIRNKSVETSFLMFPVRLETRFVDNYEVEEISEPDRALYAFQAIWNYVNGLEKPKDDALVRSARQVMRKVEELDIVYREDKSRLRNIVSKVVEATAPEGDLKSIWDRIQVHIGRLTTMDVVSDNVATEFLRKLDTVNRTFHELYNRPRYQGRPRKKEPTRYSQTAFVDSARKRVRECLPVLEQLLPDDPSDSIVNKFALITWKQYEKFCKSLDFFSISGSLLRSVYGEPDYSTTHLPLKQQIINGLSNDLTIYDGYRDRYFGAWSADRKVTINSRRQSICDKVRSRVGEYHHYTLLAEKIIIWRLRLFTGAKRDISNQPRSLKWRRLADNTVFSFHEEREWLRSVLIVYNGYHETATREMQISVDRLNRHNHAIRPGKLRYYAKKKCLLVRIYPDEVAVTQMARPFTKEEIKHALDFWIRYFYAGNDQERKAAWEALCSLSTPPRAALVARNLFSSSKAHSSISLIRYTAQSYRAKGKSFDECAKYLRNLMDDKLKTEGVDETEENTFPVPMSELMPDRFILQATLDNGGRKAPTIIRYGRLIPQTIQVGLDLNKEPDVTTSDTGPKFEDNLRWMTDYGEAEKMGMAITLPLDAFPTFHHTEKEREKYRKKNPKKSLEPTPRVFTFSSIYVMGVKSFSENNVEDSYACSALLKKVFNAHLYSDEGLELLKVGTPTNILSDEDIDVGKGWNDAANSDYDTEEKALESEFYRKSIVPYANDIHKKHQVPYNGDAQILSLLFGLAGDFDGNPFQNTANRDNQEVLKARKVNEAFLEVLGRKDRFEDMPKHVLTSLIYYHDRFKQYFIHNVLPTGVFPSFRIGNQPYGIVPVCDFKHLKYHADDPIRILKEVLVLLTEKWNKIADEQVLSEANINKQTKLSTEESYLKAVSGTPVSSSFYDRAEIQDTDLLSASYFRGKRNNFEQVTNIANIIRSKSPIMSDQEFVRLFIPKFNAIPIMDPEFSKYNKDFNWGKLRKYIREVLQGEPCMEGVSDRELDMLITGTFDLFNYRLDAWLTGLLNQRYRPRLKFKSHKISIGAYGWVFNLTEDRNEPPSYEYVVAPSVNQAVTAAVLRSSFNRAAHGKTRDYNLSVNLSSARVRQALRIIEGIRNGLSLGTILGSDLERMLHDDWKMPGGYEMDYFIYYLRKAYPLNRTDTQYAVGDSAKRDASLDVLNGVALLEDLRNVRVDNQQKFQLSELYNWDKSRQNNMWTWLKKVFQSQDQNYIVGLFEKGKDEFTKKTDRLLLLIQRMEDAYDALADVITSESVYKLTEGNRVAVEALMNSMNSGRNFPQPDVVEIPLDAAHIEQRVFAALDTDLTVDAGKSESFYQIAEPSLDDWMGKMLGFEDIQVQFQMEGGTATYSLAKTGITASELVYLSGDMDKFRSFLSLLYWHHGSETLASDESLGILLPEAEMAIDSMREMIAHARPLKQDDLIVSTIPADETLYRADISRERYLQARKSMLKLIADLRKAAEEVQLHFKEEATSYLPLSEALFRESLGYLLQCFRIGLVDALSGVDPSMLVAEEERFQHPVEYAEMLVRQASLADKLISNATILKDRLKKAAEVISASKKEELWEAYPAAMKKLFVSSFVMSLHFDMTRNSAIDWSQLSKQSSNYFSNAGKAVVEDNLVGLADVRTQLQALHQVRMYGKMNLLAAAREVRPFQLEADGPKDRNWMGAEVKDESSIRDANVFTVLNPAQLIKKDEKGRRRDIAGLMIDYWVERIPYRRQTAAVAFGYDQPDAEPPQAILMGMATQSSGHNWSEKKLLRMIHSAMYQVKSRAVEPEHVYADKWTSGLFPLLSIDPKTDI